MDRAKTVARMEGCFLAVPSFFNEDFTLNLEAQKRHTRFLLDGGVRQGNTVLLVAGAAGEFTCLNPSERLTITEAVLEEAQGQVGVIVGAQTTNQAQAVEIAKGAQKLGADAVQVSPPFYYSHTPDDVYEYIKAIADSADIGVVAYPTYWTSADISLDLMARIIEDIPSIVSLKMSSDLAWRFHACTQRFCDRVCVVDNQWLSVSAYLAGARGFNIHPANYWPEYGVNLMKLLKTGKYQKAQDEYMRVVIPYLELAWEILDTTGGEGVLDKLCCNLVGLDSSPHRPPTRDVREQFREKARTMLERIGAPRLKS